MKRKILGLAIFILTVCAAPYAQGATGGPGAASPAVSYVTGGIGEEEWAALQERAKDFNLRLLFAQKVTGAYLAGLKVTILNAKGAQILAADECGPRFFAKLPAGRYQLVIDYAGSRQKRSISVDAKRATQGVFYFP